MLSILKKIFGTRNERELKRMAPLVEKINSLEAAMKELPDEGFKDLTPGFRERLSKGETLDDLLPEAFAAVREVSWRKLGMRHFDVQLVGGIVLHEGNISEMKTGEGKTLAATLALYLNALEGKGAQLITVNDYLAKRDARWMSPIYHTLGLSVGVIQHESSLIYDPAYVGTDDEYYQLRDIGRKEAYAADITYGTNNEYGFDYLRDNMKFSLDEYVQRDLNYAIVDEVDSILIDEARTPLIISGPTEDSTEKYGIINRIIPSIKKDVHYSLDEKAKQVLLNEEGVTKVEELLKVDNLYDPRHIETLHHVNQGLYAHVMKHKDIDYVVKDGQVVIVDEFTGRLMPGRRWGDGLHQAVEAKEKVRIENENQTLATITFQNYFRMYKKLAGMTGTADTEAAEFGSTYNLDVVVIPTNMPMKRTDHPDVVYRSEKDKFKAVVSEIKEWSEKGRPVLVGTISIENSEKLSRLLAKRGVSHHVLNAKQHEREAEIVAQAGRLNAVTLSTNMAGRGTDIVLGGNPAFMAATKAGKDNATDLYRHALEAAKKLCEEEKKKVVELGGLHIIGTERHESRRIDNQLRGRSGRQGDPGSSRFYVSLDDDLMRIFGSDRIASIMDRLGMEEDVPIEHSLVSKALESAQRKVDAHNFDIRKHLLEYDDVMNQQRHIIYKYRRETFGEGELRETVKDFATEVAEDIVYSRIEEKTGPDDWDIKSLKEAFSGRFGITLEEKDILEGSAERDALAERMAAIAWDAYLEKSRSVGDEVFARVEKMFMLHTLDSLWKDHLLSMDHLKGGIGLRGYAQKNPLSEYKKEGYNLFVEMIGGLKADVVERLFKVQIEADQLSSLEPQRRKQSMTLGRGAVGAGMGAEKGAGGGAEGGGGEGGKPRTIKRATKKVGRNEPCPCGSGKKYKKCCGI